MLSSIGLFMGAVAPEISGDSDGTSRTSAGPLPVFLTLTTDISDEGNSTLTSMPIPDAYCYAMRMGSGTTEALEPVHRTEREYLSFMLPEGSVYRLTVEPLTGFDDGTGAITSTSGPVPYGQPDGEYHIDTTVMIGPDGPWALRFGLDVWRGSQ